MVIVITKTKGEGKECLNTILSECFYPNNYTYMNVSKGNLTCLLLFSLTASWLMPSAMSLVENPRYARELDFDAFSSI